MLLLFYQFNTYFKQHYIAIQVLTLVLILHRVLLLIWSYCIRAYFWCFYTQLVGGELIDILVWENMILFISHQCLCILCYFLLFLLFVFVLNINLMRHALENWNYQFVFMLCYITPVKVRGFSAQKHVKPSDMFCVPNSHCLCKSYNLYTSGCHWSVSVIFGFLSLFKYKSCCCFFFSLTWIVSH